MNFDNFTYYRMMEESLKEIKKEDKKPTLLLHSCCAPCNAYPLVLLIEYFDLTLMYNNSNIYPKEEYIRRLNELKDYVDYINKTHNVNIKLIETPYDNEEYNKRAELLVPMSKTLKLGSKSKNSPSKQVSVLIRNIFLC